MAEMVKNIKNTRENGNPHRESVQIIQKKMNLLDKLMKYEVNFSKRQKIICKYYSLCGNIVL